MPSSRAAWAVVTSSATGTSCLFGWLVRVSLTNLSRLAHLACMASLASYSAHVGAAQTTRTGWWAESVSDGGAHYGVVQTDGSTVRSVCGMVFEPLPNPWTRKAERQPQPADPAHTCPACRAALELS